MSPEQQGSESESTVARLQAAAQQSVRKEDVEIDFSKEPIFVSNREPQKIAIPGLNGKETDPDKWTSYIVVKSSVDYAVEQGRNKFASQEQEIKDVGGGRRRPSDKIKISYDLYGLFIYKCINCLVEISIQDPRSDKVLSGKGNGNRIREVITQIQSAKLCEWIEDQINEVLGWNEEEDEVEEKFSGSPQTVSS